MSEQVENSEEKLPSSNLFSRAVRGSPAYAEKHFFLRVWQRAEELMLLNYGAGDDS